MSSYVQASFTSRLFALAGMVEVLGTVLGAPILAWCFDKGLQWKGMWTGLPWLFVAVLVGSCATALSFVRPPKVEDEDAVPDQEEHDVDAYPANPVRLE
jgi:MFS transporter, PCFT/HCP family, solute carrier family 46 (folate transporter), member 1